MHDAHERLLAKIAHLYYIEDKQQSDIARSLNLSRSKVCRMLSEAHSQGIVEIHVKPKLSLHVDLEAQLEKKYNLKEVVVTESEAGRPLTQTLGLAGAQILKRLMTSQDVLGISWGQTLLSVVSSFYAPDLQGARLVQLAGCLNMRGQDMQALELLHRLGACFQTEPMVLFCPSIVASPQVKQGLLQDPRITEVLKAAGDCTIALVGIGEMGETSGLFRHGYISPDWWNLLKQSGAVGNLCMNFYDAEGRECCPAFGEVTVTTSLREIRRIPTVIGVAGGPEKVQAIAGALRLEVLNILITDSLTAKSLLE